MKLSETSACRWNGFRKSATAGDIERLSILFDNGRVAGTGSDALGYFVLYGYANGDVVVLFKRYDAPETVVPDVVAYTGTWNGQAIVGTYHVPEEPWRNGVFELWPAGPLDGGIETEVAWQNNEERNDA